MHSHETDLETPEPRQSSSQRFRDPEADSSPGSLSSLGSPLGNFNATKDVARTLHYLQRTIGNAAVNQLIGQSLLNSDASKVSSTGSSDPQQDRSSALLTKEPTVHQRLGSVVSSAIQRASAASGSRPVGIRDVQRYVDPPFVQRALPAAVEALEVALTATIVVQEQYAITLGGLHYSSDKGSRFGNPPQPYDHEYDALVFAAGASRRFYIGGDLYAAFRVHWQGNEYGEIGAAYVKVDLDHTEFSKSSLDVKFTALESMPRRGADPRLWPMQWIYEGNFDPYGPGEWEFQGKFEIDAGGGFRILEHNVKDRTTWFTHQKPDPQEAVRPGSSKPSVIPIHEKPTAPAMGTPPRP